MSRKQSAVLLSGSMDMSSYAESEEDPITALMQSSNPLSATVNTSIIDRFRIPQEPPRPAPHANKMVISTYIIISSSVLYHVLIIRCVDPSIECLSVD